MKTFYIEKNAVSDNEAGVTMKFPIMKYQFSGTKYAYASYFYE